MKRLSRWRGLWRRCEILSNLQNKAGGGDYGEDVKY
jgi:hypothetical protein